MKRQLKRNVIIICEGTDTEHGYVEALAEVSRLRCPDLFEQIRVVPTPKEVRECEARANQRRRSLKTDEPKYAGWYYTIGEISADDYKRYCAQPIRYVREGQLWVKTGTYSEAWAVYDRDFFRDADHEAARRLADSDPRLHVAFSSVSFEQWILLHFEHTPHAFERSVCKEAKKDIRCGTGTHPNDCGGQRCVGGRLRARGYMPDYDKQGRGLFALLEPRLEFARLGAAWTRTLNPDLEIWRRNPFTDFDSLVDALLDGGTAYEWFDAATPFAAAKTAVMLDGLTLTNCGDNHFFALVTANDSSFNPIQKFPARLAPGDSLALPDGTAFVTFSDRGRTCVARIPCL